MIIRAVWAGHGWDFIYGGLACPRERTCQAF